MITKTIQSLLKEANGQIVYKLLRKRELRYEEISMVGRFLESKDKYLRLLTALRIIRAVEKKQGQI